MKIYLIAYELRHPGTNAGEVYGAIKALSGGWWHHLPAVWLVYGSGLNAVGIFDRLKGVLHLEAQEGQPYDKLLITEIGKERQGWLEKQAWEWIAEGEGRAN